MDDTESIEQFCDCSDLHCFKKVVLPFKIAIEIQENGYQVIVNECTWPIPKFYKLVREEIGYKIYEKVE